MAAKKKVKAAETPMQGVAAKLGLDGVVSDKAVQSAIMGAIAGIGAHVASSVLAKSLPSLPSGLVTDPLFPTAIDGDEIMVARQEPDPRAFVGVLKHDASIEDVMLTFGGGNYRVDLRSGEGARPITQRRVIQIAGAPTFDRVHTAHRRVRDVFIEATSGQNPFTKGERVDFLRALGASLRERFPEAGAAADILESIDS